MLDGMTNEEKKTLEAAKALKKYCSKFADTCSGCIFKIDNSDVCGCLFINEAYMECKPQDWDFMAIQALEQQPCEDCVSREEALLALTGMDLPTDRDKLIALFTERIQHLPPVTPQRPKGKWIMNSDYPDRLICDKCNAQFDVWHWESKQMHYCPNCGSHNGGEENEQNSACD